MKKIISTVILLLAMAAACNASEIARNPKTGTILEEAAGVYGIRTKTGIVVLGDVKHARDFLFTAGNCFVNKNLESFSIGETKYTVHEDDEGLYIVRVGLGAVKVRPSDATLFLTKVEAIIVKEKSKKIWDVIRE